MLQNSYCHDTSLCAQGAWSPRCLLQPEPFKWVPGGRARASLTLPVTLSRVPLTGNVTAHRLPGTARCVVSKQHATSFFNHIL